MPVSYLKIVQPAEQGIVKEILVREGELVREGQVLIRMDSVMTQADVKSIETEYHNKRLALKRIDAQLRQRRSCATRPIRLASMPARSPIPGERAGLRKRARAGAQPPP